MEGITKHGSAKRSIEILERDKEQTLKTLWEKEKLDDFFPRHELLDEMRELHEEHRAAKRKAQADRFNLPLFYYVCVTLTHVLRPVLTCLPLSPFHSSQTEQSRRTARLQTVISILTGLAKRHQRPRSKGMRAGVDGV